jgi:lipopolysaccharide export system protein LptA
MAIHSVRSLRLVLLVAIGFTGAVTVKVYRAKHRVLVKEQQTRQPLERLPDTLNQKASTFKMSHSEGSLTTFRATAAKAIENKEGGKSHLEGVEIDIFGKSGDRHDHISSKACEYDANASQFYSEGEVLIHLSSMPGAVAADSAPKSPDSPASHNSQKSSADAAKTPAQDAAAPPPDTQPIDIQTSGFLYDQKKNIATTDREMTFQFRNGDGVGKGAVYDSGQQNLWLKQDVVIHIRKGHPVDIHAAELHYLQKERQIQFVKPVMIRKDATASQVISGDTGTAYLDDKQQINFVLLQDHIHGVADGKGRHSEVWANQMQMGLDDKQHVQWVKAMGDVRLDSHGPTGRSQAQAPQLAMDMTGPGNTLKQALWTEGAKVTFSPLPTAPKGQTRVITADQIEMNMKEDGKELSSARTLTPGRVEMTGGGEPRRILTARQISARFGERNAMREMHAQGQVRTDSDPPATAKPGPNGEPPAQRITTSDRLDATFNAQQQLDTMIQTGSFQYHEGDRQAAAEQAVYTITPGSNPQTGTTVLTGKPAIDPTVWDPSGRVVARKITMPDKGETLAEGDVRATQLPSKDDKKGSKRPAIFAGAKKSEPAKGNGKAGDKDKDDDPVYVLTNRLRWDRVSGLSHYDGGPNGRVRLWQGQDFLEALTVDMDRSVKTLIAVGDVYSYLVEEGKDPLRVQSERLNYNDAQRHARYEGNVVMHSQDMTTNAYTVDAWLRDPDNLGPGESRLEKAISDGKVHYSQPAAAAAPGKKAHAARQSESDHGVYTSDDDKIVLSGGHPIVRDDVRGITTGRELTWLTADDKIFVDGGPDVRTLSQHRMTKKQPQP